jgi:hypothetical protein
MLGFDTEQLIKLMIVLLLLIEFLHLAGAFSYIERKIKKL